VFVTCMDAGRSIWKVTPSVLNHLLQDYYGMLKKQCQGNCYRREIGSPQPTPLQKKPPGRTLMCALFLSVIPARCNSAASRSRQMEGEIPYSRTIRGNTHRYPSEDSKGETRASGTGRCHHRPQRRTARGMLVPKPPVNRSITQDHHSLVRPPSPVVTTLRRTPPPLGKDPSLPANPSCRLLTDANPLGC
jgi:hypothetical protein